MPILILYKFLNFYIVKQSYFNILLNTTFYSVISHFTGIFRLYISYMSNVQIHFDLRSI